MTQVATVFAAPGAVTGYAAIAVAGLMLILWLISIPLKDVSVIDPVWGPAFVLVALVVSLTAAVIPGVVLFVIGFAFETIGDEQLRRFKALSDSHGQVIDQGLWHYTRHPNYFGDFCVWWGLWLIALTAGGSWWTLIGPVLMSTLLIRVSGKGLLERDMAKGRPGYVDYVKRTSGFVPLPPKRPSG